MNMVLCVVFIVAAGSAAAQTNPRTGLPWNNPRTGLPWNLYEKWRTDAPRIVVVPAPRREYGPQPTPPLAPSLPLSLPPSSSP